MTGHVVDPSGRPYDPAGLVALPEVDPATFFALDLRVGRVLAVEPFPEARKPSVKLRVDFGPVIGELATSAQLTAYDPDELTGRLVVGVVNLPVRRIAGFASEFLVLAGLEASGVARLLDVDPTLPAGSRVA